VARFKAGDIVIVDWRGGARPREPKKSRPAIVVEDDELFHPDYPNIIVVPLTSDARLVIPGLAVTIDPTPDNGCERQSFALTASVTSVSVSRVRATGSYIRAEQLADIRHEIAEAIGIG
jgi:mRNA interferase MazF